MVAERGSRAGAAVKPSPQKSGAPTFADFIWRYRYERSTGAPIPYMQYMAMAGAFGKGHFSGLKKCRFALPLSLRSLSHHTGASVNLCVT